LIRGSKSKPTHFYGGYTGTLHAFNESALGDNGIGMTCLVKTRFYNGGANSVEKQFRRLFLDTPPQSVTSPISVKVFQDHGASVIIERTMYQAPFQSRIDFGIMAKSISVELANSSDDQDVQINGFTIESREQRRV
jgi:hypothetical protein